MELVRWNEIDGVPVHFARDLNPTHRNPGTQRFFESTAPFKSKLDATFAELWDTCGLGRADVIVSAGAFVRKPKMHGQGRAFDLDGIVWRSAGSRPGRNFWSIDFRDDARFYWGVVALLNRHMRFVIHAEVDAAHHDHIHIDDTHPAGFSSRSHSAVTYVQAAINRVHGVPIAIDGDFGPQTRGAVQQVLDRLGLDGTLDDRAVYASFNVATARLGMGAPDTVGSGPEPGRGQHRTGSGPSFELRLTDPRMESENIRELQRALLAAGFDPNGIDGRFGPDTERAVKAFQRHHGLAADGRVGPKTAGRLDGFTLRPPGDSTGTSTDWSAVPVRDRRVAAMRILTQRYGFPVNGAAGIVGNLEAESGVIPNRIEGSRSDTPMTSSDSQGTETRWTAEQVMNRTDGVSGPRLPGVGLAQWTFASRRVGLFRHEFGGNVLGAGVLFDMDAQVDYLVHELEGPEFRTKVNDVVRAAGVTVDDASDVFLLEFERPADTGAAQREKRRGFANRARNEFIAAQG